MFLLQPRFIFSERVESVCKRPWKRHKGEMKGWSQGNGRRGDRSLANVPRPHNTVETCTLTPVSAVVPSPIEEEEAAEGDSAQCRWYSETQPAEHLCEH